LGAQQQLRSNMVSPNAKDGEKKTQIPSFIKFKEKRNELDKS
jgi:hypothetical protein